MICPFFLFEGQVRADSAKTRQDRHVMRRNAIEKTASGCGGHTDRADFTLIDPAFPSAPTWPSASRPAFPPWTRPLPFYVHHYMQLSRCRALSQIQNYSPHA